VPADGRGPLPERLHHTGFTVSSLDRALEFYCEVLGCQLVARQEVQGGYLAAIVGYPEAHVRAAHVRLPGGDHVIELFEYVAPIGSTPQLEPRNVGNAHLCFVVDDLAAVYERLVETDACSFISAPVTIDAGFNTGGAGLYLRDPDGIVVELFQPPAGPGC
jgi:lactoylglutathione lyase